MAKSPQTGFENHYLNKNTSDVFLICKSDDGETLDRVPAHRIVLASKSPVFYAMFYGPLPEKGDVTLNYVTKSALKIFLQMFYCNQVDLTVTTVQEIVDLVKQYQMAHGLSVCASFMIQHVLQDNFVNSYEMALLYEMHELKLFCEISAPVLLTEENICKCSRKQLEMILQIKQLYADMDIVEICQKWAKKSCEQQGIVASDENIQIEMGECIQFIDFTSMSTQKICEAMAKCGKLIGRDALLAIVDILMTRSSAIDVNEIAWIASEYDTIAKRNIEPIEAIILNTNKLITLKAIGISPIFWLDQNNAGQKIYGQIVIMVETKPNEHKILLRESLNITPIVDAHNIVKIVQVHRFASAVIIEPNQAHILQVQLMLRNKDNIYSQSKCLIQGKITYRRRASIPTEITFSGNNIIASLGLGVEYIDPQIVRPMLYTGQ